MQMRLLFILLGALAVSMAQASERIAGTREQREQTGYEKFLQEHPDSADAHRAYAQFLFDNGNLRAAIVHWRTAQQIEPGNAATANSLGGAYLRMGRAAESAEQFRRAIRLERGNAAYHFNLANVEFMLRRELSVAWQIEISDLLRRALTEFREASRLSPNDAEYARAYAETFYAVPNADWSQAEAAWKHVLALSRQRDFAYLQLARVSLKRGDAVQARLFLDRIINTRHDALKRKLREQADRL
jgi:Tfp pilus assembly protein PilF